MIRNSFTVTDQFGDPVPCDKDSRLALSISGTFVGTIYLQKLIPPEADPTYPGHGDSRWQTVAQYTAPMVDQVAFGDGCWYRWYAAAITSGTAVCIIGRA
jgi:hypothetical protein